MPEELHATFTFTIPEDLLAGTVTVVSGDTTARAAPHPTAAPIAAPSPGKPVT